MPERQLGEVPQAAVEAALRAEPVDPTGDMTGREREVRGELEAACDPALGDQRLVPASAVADAVRAERERVLDALGYDYVDRITGDLARDLIRRLPPADGNTEEEG